MKVKTTEKQFGQTIQYECEIERLTYKQLQAYIKEAKAQGFTGIKLNMGKEALQAEVEAIEASSAKAAIDTEGHLENADQQVLTHTDNYSGDNTVSYTNLKPALTTVRYGKTYKSVLAPACNLENKPAVEVEVKVTVKEADGIGVNFVHFDRKNRVAVGDRKLEASVSLRKEEFMTGDEPTFHYAFVPCCLIGAWGILQDPLDDLIAASEEYTETMSAEDDELIAGVVVEDEQTDHESRTYQAVWYTDDDVFCECAITWYCTFNEALSKLAKLNSEGRKGKRYLACYLPGSELPYGYQYGATWDRPMVTLPEPTYSCTNSHMEPHLESELHTRLTCDICNGQRCDLSDNTDLETQLDAIGALAKNNKAGFISGSDTHKADLLGFKPALLFSRQHSNAVEYFDLDCENATYKIEVDDQNYVVRVWYCDLPRPGIAYSHPLEYGATISKWVEGVEGVHTGDHYPGQAVYPDWDESYTYGSYLNSYCELACDLWDAPVDPLDREYVEVGDHQDLPTPYIHPELGLVNAGSLNTTLLPRVTNLKFVVDGKTDLVQHVTFSAAVKSVNRIFDKAASKGNDLVLYIGLDQYFDITYYDWHKVDGMTIFSTTEPTIEYKPVGDDAFLATDLLDAAYVVSLDLL